jgi:hypothetical protein
LRPFCTSNSVAVYPFRPISSPLMPIERSQPLIAACRVKDVHFQQVLYTSQSILVILSIQ